MKLSVAIEHGTTGAWYGRFIDFPGTHARAFNRSSLLQELEKELQYHLGWMKSHNINASLISTPELIVSEEKNDINELGESGGECALFEFDKQIVSTYSLQPMLQLMAFNRFDLLKLVKSLPTSKLQFIPTGKSRNISDILMHICNAEEWYISRMGKNAIRMFLENAGISESELDNLPILKRLEFVRKACIKTLRAIVPDLGLTVFKRAEYTKYPDEKWTAYKVLRRFLEHEREHYYNIKEYIGIQSRSIGHS